MSSTLHRLATPESAGREVPAPCVTSDIYHKETQLGTNAHLAAGGKPAGVGHARAFERKQGSVTCVTCVTGCKQATQSIAGKSDTSVTSVTAPNQPLAPGGSSVTCVTTPGWPCGLWTRHEDWDFCHLCHRVQLVPGPGSGVVS